MIPKKFVVDNSGKERQKISSRKTFIKYFSKKFQQGVFTVHLKKNLNFINFKKDDKLRMSTYKVISFIYVFSKVVKKNILAY